ncbi:hypothetical protein ABK040_011380 [Willaertia magna]
MTGRIPREVRRLRNYCEKNKKIDDFSKLLEGFSADRFGSYYKRIDKLKNELNQDQQEQMIEMIHSLYTLGFNNAKRPKNVLGTVYDKVSGSEYGAQLERAMIVSEGRNTLRNYEIFKFTCFEKNNELRTSKQKQNLSYDINFTSNLDLKDLSSLNYKNYANNTTVLFVPDSETFPSFDYVIINYNSKKQNCNIYFKQITKSTIDEHYYKDNNFKDFNNLLERKYIVTGYSAIKKQKIDSFENHKVNLLIKEIVQEKKNPTSNVTTTKFDLEAVSKTFQQKVNIVDNNQNNNNSNVRKFDVEAVSKAYQQKNTPTIQATTYVTNATRKFDVEATAKAYKEELIRQEELKKKLIEEERIRQEELEKRLIEEEIQRKKEEEEREKEEIERLKREKEEIERYEREWRERSANASTSTTTYDDDDENVTTEKQVYRQPVVHRSTSSSSSRCGKSFAKEYAYLGNCCGFGSKKNNCVCCGKWPAKIPALLCSNHNFGSKKNNCAKCGKWTGSTKIQAMLCSSCGFGSKSKSCCAMY